MTMTFNILTLKWHCELHPLCIKFVFTSFCCGVKIPCHTQTECNMTLQPWRSAVESLHYLWCIMSSALLPSA